MKRTKAKSKTKSGVRKGTGRGEATMEPGADTGHTGVAEEPAAPIDSTAAEECDAPSGASQPASDESSVAALKERIAVLEQNVLRAKADYQNLQRRATIEKSEAIQFANADLMKSLLAVLDDFERSIEFADKGDDPEAVLKGVHLVYENLRKGLVDHGLECIEAADQPFDPHLHEAMMQQPSDERPGGFVLMEISKGYKLRDRVLRPAKVVVSKAIADPEKPAPESRGDA